MVLQSESWLLYFFLFTYYHCTQHTPFQQRCHLEQLRNNLTIHLQFTYTYWQNKLKHNGQSFAKISLQMHLATHRIQKGKEFHLIHQKFNSEVNSGYILIPVICIRVYFFFLCRQVYLNSLASSILSKRKSIKE